MDFKRPATSIFLRTFSSKKIYDIRNQRIELHQKKMQGTKIRNKSVALSLLHTFVFISERYQFVLVLKQEIHMHETSFHDAELDR